MLTKYFKDLDSNEINPIIGIHHCFEDNDNVYILLEYCEGEELYNKIAKGKGIPEDDVVEIFGQIVHGVHSMQSIGVFHRDLKLSNIIIQHDSNKIKIIDFGLAVKVGQNEE